MSSGGRTGEDEEENEDEDMGVAETYADYMPSKCKYYKLKQILISNKNNNVNDNNLNF